MFLPALLHHLIVSIDGSNDPEKGRAHDEANHSADEHDDEPDAHFDADPSGRRTGPGDLDGNIKPDVGREAARQPQHGHEHFDEEELEDAGQEYPTQGLAGERYQSLPWTSTTDSSENATKSSWYQRLKHTLGFDSFKTNAEDTNPNYRYTPILSGVVIPFSILLEIPGLTEHWYVRTEGGKIVETRPNPILLDVGLGLSLTCAVIANICLIARFLERKVKLMTWLCIGFLTIHSMSLMMALGSDLAHCTSDIINITTVTVFGVQHRTRDGFTYGPSFWITFCSTVASSFTNLTLIIDYVRTPDFAHSGTWPW